MPQSALRIASKLPDVGTTIFTVMSRLALEHGAINLSQGFPDFDCDPALVDAVARHMRDGRNRSADAGCSAAPRSDRREVLRGLRPPVRSESEITVTSGGTEAIFDAVAAVVRPGDEVVVFEPCYDSYVPAIQINGGVPVVMTLGFPDYSIDWDAVRRAISPRTRMLVLNSPHNPSGSIPSEEDIRHLVDLVDGTDILIRATKCTSTSCSTAAATRAWRDTTRSPRAASSSELLGKLYHTTGWKIGYCAAASELSSEFRKVHQFVTFASHTPTQLAFADFLARKEGYPGLTPFYQAKRDLFLSLMEGSRFQPLPCRGSLLSADELLVDHRRAGCRVCDAAAEGSRRRLYPDPRHSSKTPPPPVLRFCFAKKDETLEHAAERLRRV